MLLARVAFYIPAHPNKYASLRMLSHFRFLLSVPLAMHRVQPYWAQGVVQRPYHKGVPSTQHPRFIIHMWRHAPGNRIGLRH